MSGVCAELQLHPMAEWKGEDEVKEALKSLASAKGISATRIKGASAVLMKWSKEYKRVVHAVENVMWRAESEFRLAYMYLIDALIRASMTKGSDDKGVFAKRFGLHLEQTLNACRKVPDENKANVKRVVLEWTKRGVFTPEDIESAGGADFLGDGPLNSPTPGEPDKEKITSLLDNLKRLKEQGSVVLSQPRPEVEAPSPREARREPPPQQTHPLRHSPPRPQYHQGPPQNPRYDSSYGTSGAPQYAAPSQYDAPPQYGAPPPQYGAPPPQYGAPPPQYGAPPSQYGAPPPQYGAPPPQYGAPPPTNPPFGSSYPRQMSGTSPRPTPDALKRPRSRSRSRSPMKRTRPPLICRDFQVGRCTRGSNCRFPHGAEDNVGFGGMRPPRPMQPNHPKMNPHQVKTRLCNSFPNCRFGDRCTFAHGERELGTSYAPNLEDKTTGHNNNIPPHHTAPLHPPTTAAMHQDTSSGYDAEPPRQRRSRWEDKQPMADGPAAPAIGMRVSPPVVEPPKVSMPPPKKEDPVEEAPVLEFTLEYDDE
ncbi:Aste57867_24849 [Aphanomyces stellatus]|uniref:Aste57867_24849 protein n=1 Tax=Aphanomyces stellatus TaxID=120398 RepID=A0A485LRL9_9STRA|nr:hypothetical protein As57867_024771 [Aphanomyces stellatus]VFU01483.1 Aste57867_24849 [Aphanomyces stellatus]